MCSAFQLHRMSSIKNPPPLCSGFAPRYKVFSGFLLHCAGRFPPTFQHNGCKQNIQTELECEERAPLAENDRFNSNQSPWSLSFTQLKLSYAIQSEADFTLPWKMDLRGLSGTSWGEHCYGSQAVMVFPGFQTVCRQALLWSASQFIHTAEGQASRGRTGPPPGWMFSITSAGKCVCVEEELKYQYHCKENPAFNIWLKWRYRSITN